MTEIPKRLLQRLMQDVSVARRPRLFTSAATTAADPQGGLLRSRLEMKSDLE